jgi:hypothetical protein
VAWYIFDFTAFPDGASTPLSETLVGSPTGPMTARYTAGPADPGAFAILPSPLADKTLVRSNDDPAAVLSIIPARSFYGIAVHYQVFGTGPILMDVFSDGRRFLTFDDDDADAWVSAIPVGGYFPNRFDAVVLRFDRSTSSAGSFGVSEVIVMENLPEPIGLGMLGAGLVGLVLLRRHRR